MSEPSQVILPYGRPVHRRRRWIIVCTLLVTVIGSAVYWRAPISRFLQLQYHTAMLYRAEKRAMSLHVPGGLVVVDTSNPSLPTNPQYDQAYQDVAVEFAALQRMGLAGYWMQTTARSPVQILLAPMVTPQGKQRLVFVQVGPFPGRITAQAWDVGSLISLPTPKSFNYDVAGFDSDRNSAIQIKTAAFDPAKPSEFTFSILKFGRQYDYRTQLNNDFTATTEGIGWYDSADRQNEPAHHPVTMIDGSEPLVRIKMMTGPTAVGFLPSGEFVIAAPDLWQVFKDLDHPLEMHRSAPHPLEGVGEIMLSPSGKYLFCRLRDKCVVTDTSDGRIVAECPQFGQGDPFVTFNDDVLVCENQNRRRAFDLKTGGEFDASGWGKIPLRGLGGNHAASMEFLTFSQSHPMFHASVTDITTNTLLCKIPAFPWPQSAMSISPDGRFFSELEPMGIEITAIPQGVCVMQQSKALRDTGGGIVNYRWPLLWSADSKWVSSFDSQYLYLWQAPQFDRCWRFKRPGTGQFSLFPRALSPDGRWFVATAIEQGNGPWVWIWDLHSLEQTQPANRSSQ